MSRLDELRAEISDARALLSALLVEARELHYQLVETRKSMGEGRAAPVEQCPQPGSLTYNHLIPLVTRAPTYGKRIPTISSDDYSRWNGQLAPSWQREGDAK